MNPGATMLPVASMTSAPDGVAPGGNTAVMRSPSISTVPGTGSAPVPSATRPPVTATRPVTRPLTRTESLLFWFEGELGDGVRRDQRTVHGVTETGSPRHLY